MSSPVNFELDKLIAYVDRQLRDIQVRHSPFPHLIIRDILPISFYRKFIEAIPVSRSKFSRSCPQIEERDENTYILYASDFEQLSEDHEKMVQLLRPLMQYIACQIYEKLKGHIKNSWELFLGDEAEERFKQVVPSISSSLSILDRTVNYNQSPHLDGAYRLGAVLLYMAEDESSQNLGTDLYYVEGVVDQEIHRRNFFSRKPDDLNLVLAQTTVFTPNTIFATINSPISFHGLQSLQRHLGSFLPRRMTMNTWVEMTEDSFQNVFHGFTHEELGAWGK